MDNAISSGGSWQRIEQIILGIGDLDEAQIPEYLARACGDDPALLSQVDRLLALDDGSDSELQITIAQSAMDWFRQPDADRSSAVLESCRHGRVGESGPAHDIGVYRVLRKLGEGGSATVYLAERSDDLYEQRVAIKILCNGPWNAQLERRFMAERQILATLDHPNIARLLDGGTTDDGSPYLVMELVEGESVDRYCDRSRLTIDERLRLFMSICSAVHFAHQCQVVHRDIKPSNVYVTDRGVPKLLDFGIAKLLPREDETANADASVTGAPAPLTPRYASPEQLKGDTITTASDVYSLGLLLYLLLTGRRPFGEDSSPAAVWQARSMGSPPTRPSATVGQTPAEGPAPSAESVATARHAKPAELRRRLTGDLDNIVAMALHEEPERRYASAAQLAEDLERHLKHRPVRARRDHFGYRQRRFIRRHRLGVTLAALVFLLICSGVVALVYQADRIAQERDRANRVSRLVADLFEIAQPGTTEGSEITAKELLDRGAERVLELPAEPETVELLSTLARLYGRLGLFDRTAALYESALGIQQENHGEHRPEMAETLNALAIAWVSQGHFERAEQAFQRALDIRLQEFGESHEKTADSLNNLALIHHDLGRYKQARKLYNRALVVERRLFGTEQASASFTSTNLALLHVDEGDFRKARDLYQDILDGFTIHGEQSSPQVAESLKMLGVVSAELGDSQKARRLCERALQIERRALGAQHPDLARNLDALGFVYLITGELDAAEPLLRQALALRMERLGEQHSETAWSLEHWAEFQRLTGDFEAAENHYSRAVRVFVATLPAGHPLISRAQTGLGALLAENGRCREAESVLDLAAAARSEAFAPNSWPVAETRAVMAFCAGDHSALEANRAMLVQRLGEHHYRSQRSASWIDLLAKTL